MRSTALTLCLAAALAVACEPYRPPADISGSPSAAGAFKTTISTGQQVTLADHALAKGRTVFEFTADW